MRSAMALRNLRHHLLVSGATGSGLTTTAGGRRRTSTGIALFRHRRRSCTSSSTVVVAAAASATAVASSAVASTSASRLFAHLPSEAREEVSRVVELAERAASRWTIDRSPFLPPPLVAAALAALEPLNVGAVAWGGFAGAERQRVIVGRPEMLVFREEEKGGGDSGGNGDDCAVIDSSNNDAEEPQDPWEQEGFSPPPNRRKARSIGGGGGGGGGGRAAAAAAAAGFARRSSPPLDLLDPGVGGVCPVSITGNFVFDQASHRDFLGAILGSAGLDRRVVGDVLLRGERGAVALVAPEVVEALQLSLARVRSVPVEVRGPERGALDDLRAVTAQFSSAAAAENVGTTVRSVEASLRVDAVASAGFRAARSAAAAAARGGELRLNYREVKPSAPVAAGDLLSWRGKGRLKVVGVEETKRGKFAVEMERFAR